MCCRLAKPPLQKIWLTAQTPSPLLLVFLVVSLGEAARYIRPALPTANLSRNRRCMSLTIILRVFNL